MRAWAYKLMPFMNRWSNAAPAACCGVCRACYTTTATNFAATAGGIALEVVGIRRELRGDDATAREGAGEFGEDRQIGVQPNPVQPTDAEGHKRPFVLEATELPLYRPA